MSCELGLDEILKITEAKLIRRGGEASIGHFSIDSRTLKRGDCFVALRGRNFDGHDFVREAVERGAIGVICERRVDLGERGDVFVVEVRDTYETLYRLAEYKRGKFEFEVIAVTGSNGKTTVKELIAEFLNLKYPAYKNFLNQNNLLGVSLNILNCTGDYKYGVFEIGISEIGEIDRLLEILKPNHGLITNIGPTHLEFLGDEEVVFSEKVKLFKGLKEGGFAFYTLDDPWLSKLDRDQFPKLNFRTFGFSSLNDYWGPFNTNGLKGIEVLIWGKENLKAPLLGRQNALNLIAALSVALEFGVDLKDIREGLKYLKPLPHRMHHLKLGNMDVIDDSYNSNPLSLKAALEFLSGLEEGREKIAILGDMLELGKRSEELHYECGKYAAGLRIDKFLCYGNEMRAFLEGFKSVLPEGRVYWFQDGDELLSFLLDLIKGNSELILLFKASHGMRADLILEGLKENFAYRHAL